MLSALQDKNVMPKTRNNGKQNISAVLLERKLRPLKDTLENIGVIGRRITQGVADADRKENQETRAIEWNKSWGGAFRANNSG